jgi:hypothetical protein
MNHLVFLDTRAGDLEKILSGVKCMVIKKIDPQQSTLYPVSRGDGLYFLKEKDDYALRVKATVKRVLTFINNQDEDLPRSLKEVQSKLQLTEDQYNFWSVKDKVLLVEFECAQKISVIQIAPDKVMDRSDWIAFEEFSLVLKKEVTVEK